MQTLVKLPLENLSRTKRFIAEIQKFNWKETKVLFRRRPDLFPEVFLWFLFNIDSDSKNAIRNQFLQCIESEIFIGFSGK